MLTNAETRNPLPPLASPPSHSLPDVVQITRAVGDQLRAMVLRVLHQDSFGVLELCAILDIAQPAMSHHLKKLSDVGLITHRREGNHHFYQRANARSDPLITALYAALDQVDLPEAVAAGIERIHQQRVAQSRHFFAHQADALKQQTTRVCAASVYASSVLELVLSSAGLQRHHALEVGPGEGTLLAALAPHFERVTGLDNAVEMLSQARPATVQFTNVMLLEADFIHLSATPQYDLIVAAMVLHHLPSPAQFFRQAARLLQPHGLIVLAELCSHDQDWVRDACGDVWLGFDPDQLDAWAHEAGLQQAQQQFLAQRNGFRVQVTAYTRVPALSSSTKDST